MICLQTGRCCPTEETCEAMSHDSDQMKVAKLHEPPVCDSENVTHSSHCLFEVTLSTKYC